MRSLRIGLALLIVATATPSAQVVTDGLPVFTDRVEVNLVTLRVVVTTLLDHPVTDLTRDDFEIWEDGERREITHFERVSDGRIDEPRAGNVRAADDILPPPSDLQRLVVLAFDSSSVEDLPFQRRAITAAQDFVNAHSDAGVQWSVALVGGDPRCLVPPTTDTKTVFEGLNSLHNLFGGVLTGRTELPVSFRATSQAPLMAGTWCSLSMAEQAVGMPETTRALTNLFKAYGAIPGAKACVFFHPGSSSDAPFAGCGGLNSRDMMRYRDITNLWLDVARQASTAGFKIYGMSSRGLEVPVANADSRTSAVFAKRSILSFSTTEAAAILAVRTGGDTFESNDLEMVIDTATRDTGAYYSLAFIVPHAHDGKIHDIDVKVHGRGPLKVRHKKGYYDFDPRTILVEQLATPSEFSKQGGALPVELDLHTKIVGDDRMEVKITAATPLSSLALIPLNDGLSGNIDVFLAVHDDSGHLRGITEDQQRIFVPGKPAGSKHMHLERRILVPATENTVTIAIYDPISGLSGMDSAVAQPGG